MEQVGRQAAGGVVGADPDVDGEPEVAELVDAAPGDVRVGVLERDDHAGDTGLDEGPDAGRRAPLVRAGFERGEHGGPAGPVAGSAQGFDLGVGAPGRLCGALAHDLAVAHDDRADPRVGRGATAGGVALGQCPAHELGVCGHQLRSVSRLTVYRDEE